MPVFFFLGNHSWIGSWYRPVFIILPFSIRFCGPAYLGFLAIFSRPITLNSLKAISLADAEMSTQAASASFQCIARYHAGKAGDCQNCSEFCPIGHNFLPGEPELGRSIQIWRVQWFCLFYREHFGGRGRSSLKRHPPVKLSRQQGQTTGG